MTRIFRLAALAALLFPLAAIAQDRPDRGDRAERHIERLTERLSLTDAQVAIVREGMTQAREGERGPGASWTLAARLAPTLSEAQIAALKQRPERGPRADGDRQRDGDSDRAERRAERREQMTSARDAALGLTDAQKQALADRREEHRAERGERRGEMAEILTDEQEAVLLVHRALSPRGAMRGHRGGRGDGARRGGPRK